jgi:hypothetical protein
MDLPASDLPRRDNVSIIVEVRVFQLIRDMNTRLNDIVDDKGAFAIELQHFFPVLAVSDRTGELGRVALQRVRPLHIIDDDKVMITGGGGFATNDENATIGKHSVDRNTGIGITLKPISVRPFGAIHSYGLKARHSARLRSFNPKRDGRLVQTLCSDLQSEKQAKRGNASEDTSSHRNYSLKNGCELLSRI